MKCLILFNVLYLIQNSGMILASNGNDYDTDQQTYDDKPFQRDFDDAAFKSAQSSFVSVFDEKAYSSEDDTLEDAARSIESINDIGNNIVAILNIQNLKKFAKKHQNQYQLYKLQYDTYPTQMQHLMQAEDSTKSQFDDHCKLQFISNFQLINAGVNGAFEAQLFLKHSGNDFEKEQKYGLDANQIKQLRPIYQDIISNSQNTDTFVTLMYDGLKDCKHNLKNRMKRIGLKWKSALPLYKQFVNQYNGMYQYYKQQYDKYPSEIWQSMQTKPFLRDEFIDDKCKQIFIDSFPIIQNGINGMFNSHKTGETTMPAVAYDDDDELFNLMKQFYKEAILTTEMLDEMTYGMQDCEQNLNKRIQLIEKSMKSCNTQCKKFDDKKTSARWCCLF